MKSLFNKLKKKTSPFSSPTLVPASPQLVGLTKVVKSPDFYSFSLDGSLPPLDNDFYNFSLDGSTDSLKSFSLEDEEDSGKFECYQELSIEIKMHIISFLSSKELNSLSQCSKEMYTLTHDRLVWVNLFQKSGWELSKPLKENENLNLISYYQMKSNLTSKDALLWKTNNNPIGKIPSKRYKHTSICYKHYVIFIGGQETNTKRFSEIIYYNTKTNMFYTPTIKGDQPPSFSRHTARVVKNKVFIFGGFNGAGQYYNLAILDLKSKRWINVNQSLVSGDIPVPRSNHTSAVIGNRYYIFSGNNTADDGQYRVLDDFYYLDTKTLEWHKINASGDIPCGRGGHSMETIDGKIYLFGGGVWSQTGGWTKRFNDIHVYDPEMNHWTKQSVCGDIPVTSTFTASFVYGRYLMLFGGGCYKTNRVTNTTYALDTIAMRWHKLQYPDNIEDPRPRDMASATIINNKVYLYGGFSSGAIDYCDQISLNFKPLTL